MMRWKVPSIVAPSTAAADSSSSGMASKNPRSIHIENGSENAVYGNDQRDVRIQQAEPAG